MKTLRISAILAVVVYLIVVAVFFTTQRSLLYYPTHRYTPPSETQAGSAFRALSYRTADGLNLKAWYAPAREKPLTIVFFHGNADSLATASPIAEPYIQAGYGFLLAEYRGYSGMPGSPTETGLYNDGRALLHALIAQGVEPRRIILFGHSLGTGVAVQMASEFHVGGLMLLAPYQSIPKLAQPEFPFLPVGLLALDRFDNEKKIASVHVATLIANGSEDQVIPPAHGIKLFASANEPKEFQSIPGRGHNDAFDDFAPLSLRWMEQTSHALAGEAPPHPLP